VAEARDTFWCFSGGSRYVRVADYGLRWFHVVKDCRQQVGIVLDVYVQDR